jgi:hypothetical protein
VVALSFAFILPVTQHFTREPWGMGHLHKKGWDASYELLGVEVFWSLVSGRYDRDTWKPGFPRSQPYYVYLLSSPSQLASNFIIMHNIKLCPLLNLECSKSGTSDKILGGTTKLSLVWVVTDTLPTAWINLNSKWQ